jgi:hypothetical protein
MPRSVTVPNPLWSWNHQRAAANGLPIPVDNSPTHHLSRIGNEKRPSTPESEAVQRRRVNGWATTCPQSWDLPNREIRVATCAGRPLHDNMDCYRLLRLELRIATADSWVNSKRLIRAGHFPSLPCAHAAPKRTLCRSVQSGSPGAGSCPKWP